MELIPKEKARHSTYFKRKKGLIKKLYEFHTLCGVDTLMIAYGPQQGDRPVEVETYPEEPKEVQQIIERYQKVPEEDKIKRTNTLKNFFEDQKRKSEAELAKLREKYQELQHVPLLDDLVTLEQLQELYQKIDVRKEMVEQKIKSMKGMSGGSAMDGGKKVAAGYPNASVQDLNPYYTSNIYNNHDEQTMWRRDQEMMRTQPFGYPAPLEYRQLNTIPATKDYAVDHENLSSIHNSAPMFVSPDGCSNYGYVMGTYNPAGKINPAYWDGYHQNQHMGSAMMPPSMYQLFQPQHQLSFMNPTQQNQMQFMPSGTSSQMHQQPQSSPFGFHEGQTNN
ncbi:hypothetical protein MKW94_006499 [Papaver nudicaule]|uniref:MADS-box domain-containing protein n=1 Tax=Papaver nudicaule TaxID=74823 RepID=A0AA42B2Y3_PAPNU|nr:hypothetical protein [Papaver nudicaule]